MGGISDLTAGPWGLTKVLGSNLQQHSNTEDENVSSELPKVAICYFFFFTCKQNQAKYTALTSLSLNCIEHAYAFMCI